MASLDLASASVKVCDLQPRIAKVLKDLITDERGRSMDNKYLCALINASSYIWYDSKDDFEFIFGVQRVGPFAYNLWILYTDGIKKYARVLIRSARKFEDYLRTVLGSGEYILVSEIPAYFKDAINLAGRLGFELDNDLYVKELV